MLKKEKLLRYIVSNLVIILVVGGIFTATVFASPAIKAVTGDSPVYKGSSKTGVAIMVNVYSGTEYLLPMLDILDAASAKATFFVGGIWAEKNETTLKEIYMRGHEIGSHGYLHKSHSKLDRAGNFKEIDVTHKLIKSILGIDMNLFAPPSGDYSDITVGVAKELGYKTIMWTKDTIDWRDQDSALITKRATSGLEAGNLILTHPTAATVKSLSDIITAVSAKGLALNTVSEVL